MLRFQAFALYGFVLLSMFSAGCCCIKPHCGSSGCGEMYVDEWWNHPPTEDPCTTCGDYSSSCGCGASHLSHQGHLGHGHLGQGHLGQGHLGQGAAGHSCLGNGCGSHGCAGHGSCLPLLNRLCGLWGIRYAGPVHVAHGGCSSCGEVGCSSCGSAVVADGGSYIDSGAVSNCPSCAAGHAGHSHGHVSGESIIEQGEVHQDAGHGAGSHEPTPAKIEPKAEAHAPAAGHSARSTSPALRKRSAVQQASAVKPLRRR